MTVFVKLSRAQKKTEKLSIANEFPKVRLPIEIPPAPLGLVADAQYAKQI